MSGDKSIITKGRAFLTHPFWISDDDKFYTRFFDEHGGDPYQLAEEIYAEKVKAEIRINVPESVSRTSLEKLDITF